MGNRGSILFLVVILIMVTEIIGMSVVYLNSREQIHAHATINRMRAFYMAQAGEERARSWIKNIGILPEQMPGFSSPYYPFGSSEVILEPQPPEAPGGYLVSITAAPGNAGSPDKYYVISSTGYAGNMRKSVSASVAITVNMKYAYFSEYEGQNGTTVGMSRNQKIYFSTGNAVQGRLHTNDQFNRCYFAPPAGSTMTAARGFYDYAAQTTSPANAQYVPLFGKLNLDAAKNKARQPGNIYTKSGDLNITLGVSGNGNRITCNGTSYNVPANGMLAFAENHNITIASEVLGNGATTQFTGQLTAVSSGTGGTGRIFITNVIETNADTGGSGCVGLAATNDIALRVTSIPGDIHVDALLATTSTFWAEDWDTRELSMLYINGGVVQKYASPLSYGADSETEVSIDYGYLKNITYNNKLPPYFPGTLNYKTYNWSEQSTTHR